ncbi:hypothetical protein GCM10022420_096030 [Streptomyces iranensis]
MGDGLLDPVRQLHGDHVTPADAQRRESRGDAVRAPVELRDRHLGDRGGTVEDEPGVPVLQGGDAEADGR